MQAVLFALAHGFGLLRTTQVLLVGLVLGVLVRRRGTLASAIIAHVAVNALATVSWLVATGGPEPTWLGVGSVMREHEGHTVLELVDLAPGSPAARAGLVAGDLLLEVDGAPAPSTHDELRAIVRSRAPGSTLVLGISRAGARLEVRVARGAAAALRRGAMSGPGIRGSERFLSSSALHATEPEA